MNLNKSWIQGVSCKFEDADFNDNMVKIAKSIPLKFLADFKPQTWLKEDTIVLYNENNSAFLCNFGWNCSLSIINSRFVKEDISHFIFFYPITNTYFKIAFPDIDIIFKEIGNEFGDVFTPVILEVLEDCSFVDKIKVDHDVLEYPYAKVFG